MLPSKALLNMPQTGVFSPDIFSLDILSSRTFCPHGRFVPTDVLSAGRFVAGRFVPTDVLSDGCFVRPDVLSPRTICPYRCFVHVHLSPDVLSLDVLSPDVLSGHQKNRLASRLLQQG